MKYNVLVVDDEIDNLQLFMRTFRKNYNVLMANSGHEALEILSNNKVDVIISDQKMPVMGGSEFLAKSIDISPDSIRILVTAYTDANALISSINQAKIFRYVKKPWNPDDLLNIVYQALELYQLNIDNQELVLDLKELFSGTISAITEALDAKDSYTFGRSKRVTLYAFELGKKYGLSNSELSEIELAGILHDIGMIGISETILNKPGNLTPEEFAEIKKHVMLGVKILEDIKQLETVINIIKCHHERFDGKGYPHGLAGEEIPIGARIISIADAYDGMVSDRAYRKGLPHDVAIAEIKKSAGAQFDPNLVDIFLSIINSIRDRII